MVAHEKKRFIKGNFFKVRIEYSSEKNPERKGWDNKF
jgi:hypothetical protein